MPIVFTGSNRSYPAVLSHLANIMSLFTCYPFASLTEISCIPAISLLGDEGDIIIAHDVCYISATAHCEVLQTTSSLYLASTLSQLQQTSQTEQLWSASKDPVLRECASILLMHIVKLLCVYVHIIEERDPEAKEKVCYQFPSPVITSASPIRGYQCL